MSKIAYNESISVRWNFLFPVYLVLCVQKVSCPCSFSILNMYTLSACVCILLVTFWSWALGQSSSHPLTLAEFGEPQSPGYRPLVCREAAVVVVAGLYHWSKWLFCPQSKYECRDVTKHWAESHHTTGLWKRSESIWLKANSTLKTAGKVMLVCCYRLPNVFYFKSHDQEICFIKNVVLQCHWQSGAWNVLSNNESFTTYWS